MVCIEDRAEQLILPALTILVAAIGILLLWKTARVISLAAEFQPVLGLVAALTTISLAPLNMLRGRRDRRHRQAHSEGSAVLSGGPCGKDEHGGSA